MIRKNIPPKIKKKARVFVSSLPIQCEGPNQCKNARKTDKSHNIRKEKVKLFYSHTAWPLQKTSYIRFVGNAKKHTKILLELISKFFRFGNARSIFQN